MKSGQGTPSEDKIEPTGLHVGGLPPGPALIFESSLVNYVYNSFPADVVPRRPETSCKSCLTEKSTDRVPLLGMLWSDAQAPPKTFLGKEATW